MISAAGTIIAVGGPFALVGGLRKVFVTTRNEGISTPFVRGAATAFVALVAETFLWDYLANFIPAAYELQVRAFLLVALPEELVKIALIYLVVTQHHQFGFRQTGIICAAIGAGFAAAENVFYIFHFGDAVILPRLLTATPFHICVAIVAGKLIFSGYQRGRSEFIPLALMTATLLHGCYDYLLLADPVGNGRFLFALALTSSLAINLLRQEKRS